MRIRIDYTTRYDYELAASHVIQLLRVQPRATEDQHILSWRVEVDADGRLRSGFDVYGNVIHTFYAERAIAAALSDVDALISVLDQLIVKKRDLKQAAMQQLLTGKRRVKLPESEAA